MAEDDESKLLEAAKKLPLNEQTTHKNWKVRSQAFDSIKQTCDRALGDQDTVLAEFGKHPTLTSLTLPGSFARLIGTISSLLPILALGRNSRLF